MEARLERLAAAVAGLSKETLSVDDELVVDSQIAAVVGVEKEAMLAALADRPPALPTNAEHHLRQQRVADLPGTLEAGLADVGVEGPPLPGLPESEVLALEAGPVDEQNEAADCQEQDARESDRGPYLSSGRQS